MKILILFALILLNGCATKFIIPGTRFLTPETQGGFMNGQFEFQTTSANQMIFDTSEGTADRGVMYGVLPRSGYLFSSSLLDELDLFWYHTGTANSMLGAKFQFVGGSRQTREVGHKLAVAAAMGGNEHITEGQPEIEFTLTAQELILLYGYRFSENFMTYANLSRSSFNFKGRVNAGVLRGLEPEAVTSITAGHAGLELSYRAVFMKFECGYQLIDTTNTAAYNALHYGYSFGFTW
jgi:hypothetical protein